MPELPTVVVATRDRCTSLHRTLTRLTELPGRPPVVVVDNASSDGSAAMVAADFPAVRLVRLSSNWGAVARNVGVARAATRYVAFADDDSWWEPDALPRAAAALDASPDVGVVVARVLLGEDRALDDVSAKMRTAVLGAPPELPGPPVLSFPAFAAVLRRSAFLDCGGFSPLLHFGGEEHLLVLDLAAHGWVLCYLDDVVARHGPEAPVSPRRWATQERNDVLTSWLRRPLPVAAADTLALARRAHDPEVVRALGGLARRLPPALRQRRVVPPDVEAAFRRMNG